MLSTLTTGLLLIMHHRFAVDAAALEDPRNATEPGMLWPCCNPDVLAVAALHFWRKYRHQDLHAILPFLAALYNPRGLLLLPTRQRALPPPYGKPTSMFPGLTPSQQDQYLHPPLQSLRQHNFLIPNLSSSLGIVSIIPLPCIRMGV